MIINLLDQPARPEWLVADRPGRPMGSPALADRHGRCRLGAYARLLSSPRRSPRTYRRATVVCANSRILHPSAWRWEKIRPSILGTRPTGRDPRGDLERLGTQGAFCAILSGTPRQHRRAVSRLIWGLAPRP